MEKYLICIDGDGTLRNDEGEISEYSKDILNKVTEKGHYVVLTTGRPRYHAEKINDIIGGKKYIISSNGAEIYDNANKKVLSVETMNSESVNDIYEYAMQNNIRFSVVTENIEYVSEGIKNDSQYLIPDNAKEFFYNKPIKQLMLVSDDTEKIINAKEYISNNINYIKVVNGNEKNTWVSFGSNSISKGEALKTLAKKLNLDIKNTIAIGNDYNDLPMFKVAGISVATENANEDIKNSVKMVTESNNNDGVAKFLTRLL